MRMLDQDVPSPAGAAADASVGHTQKVTAPAGSARPVDADAALQTLMCALPRCARSLVRMWRGKETWQESDVCA